MNPFVLSAGSSLFLWMLSNRNSSVCLLWRIWNLLPDRLIFHDLSNFFLLKIQSFRSLMEQIYGFSKEVDFKYPCSQLNSINQYLHEIRCPQCGKVGNYKINYVDILIYEQSLSRFQKFVKFLSNTGGHETWDMRT